MSRAAIPAHPPAFRTLHLLLGIQTVVVILGSLNRLGAWTRGYAAPNEFLRLVDLFNMLPLPIISVAASGGLFFVLAYDNGRYLGGWHKVFGLLFLLAVYVLGASYGSHEVTNYLNSRFCIETPLPGGEDLCRIILYNDDEFSHYLFFAAFVTINTILMMMQVLFPQFPPSQGRGNAFTKDNFLLVFNSVFIALGVMANLAFEPIGFDLIVIVLLALVAAVLLYRYGRQPLLIYYTAAYWLGLGFTLAVPWLL